MDPIMGNPQQTGTPDNNGSTTESKSLSDIMNGMTASDTPGTKPESAIGDNGNGQTQNSQQTQAVELPKWTSQLTEEIRNNSDTMKQLGKFQNLSDLAKSYSELESKLGSSLTKPSDNASPEETQSFYEKLGKPKNADGYNLTGENTQPFKEIAFKNNLTEAQAQGIYNELTNMGKGVIQMQQQNMVQKANELETALKTEYGNQYESKIKLLEKAVMAYGGKNLGAKLKDSGLLFDSDVVHMFINLGEMSQEAATTIKGNGSADSYKSTVEGGHFDFF